MELYCGMIVILCFLFLASIGLLIYFILRYNKIQKKYKPIIDTETELVKTKKELASLNNTILQQRQQWQKEYSETTAKMKKEFNEKHNAQNAIITKQRNQWQNEYSETTSELQYLKNELDTLRDTVEIQSFGIYEPRYDFGSSTQYKTRLDEIRQYQKQMVKLKTAAVCPTEWSVEGSKVKGRQMTNRIIKLLLRAFNGECDAAIMKVKFNNVDSIEKRIKKAHTAINKLGEPNHCHITSQYLELKLNELYLVHEYEEKKNFEKEEQRQIKARIREEQKALREIEKAQKEAEREEKRYNTALEKARKELQLANEKDKEKYEVQILELQKRLEEAQSQKERAISMAQITKSGYVYVISNIGSFGKNVYKIGMTRRLEPMDRIRELSGASVPFKFDVHAMIYSTDAPGLENTLHTIFINRRVNLVNNRKEFYKLTLDEIENEVRKHHPDIEFIRTAVAEEYRKTISIIESKHTEKAEPNPDEIDTMKRRFEERMANWQAEAG